jgi:hypothetical protein
MIFFDYFALILMVAFLAPRFGRNQRGLTARERRALGMFVVALILYYPVSGIFVIGAYASFVARPVGVVLGILSFRGLCVGAMEQGESTER